MLADVDDVGELADAAQLGDALVVAFRLQRLLELERTVEVVLDGALAQRGDDDHLVEARCRRLFHRVLDDRRIDERQHLLGLRFRRRQQACAVAGRKDDGLSHGHADEGPLVDLI